MKRIPLLIALLTCLALSLTSCETYRAFTDPYGNKLSWADKHHPDIARRPEP